MKTGRFLPLILTTVLFFGCGAKNNPQPNISATSNVPEVTEAATTLPEETQTTVPTPLPTVEPTVEPTIVPTLEPTIKPTVAATLEPTATPTVRPTETPTLVPTMTPTIVPTISPTVTITETPTPTPTEVPTPKEKGFSLTSPRDRYILTMPFAKTPRTFEATFECNAPPGVCGFVFAGDYKDIYRPGLYFGIDKNGYPTLFVNYEYQKIETFTIPEFVLKNGRHNVAFSVFDDRVCGYLDGRLLLEKETTQKLPDLTSHAFSILGDDTANNSYWFRGGNVFDLNFFSDARSIEKIKKDFEGIDVSDTELLASFDFRTSKNDKSSNKNIIETYWFDGEYMPKDSYKYTIALVGDIQTTVNKYPEKVSKIFDYVIDNKDNFNIKRVLFLGDLTDTCSDEEWTLVKSQVERLDGSIPYSLARGNHDGFIGTPRKLDAFNDFFGGETSPYSAQYDGCFNGKIDNTYTLMDIDGIKYLFLILDFAPTDDVLNWANEICQKYNDRKVIIAMHSFLFCNGSLKDTMAPQEKYFPNANSAEQIWDKFVSNHANISMVISGHTPSNDIVVKNFTGKNGNNVKALLADFQYVDLHMGGDGMVNLLHFDENGNPISIETVSTVNNKFYKRSNQMHF